MRRLTFSKLLLLVESAIVLYSTVAGFRLSFLAVQTGFVGSVPWVTTMLTAAWSAYGTSAAFYYQKAKAENTLGGVVYAAACSEREEGKYDQQSEY